MTYSDANSYESNLIRGIDETRPWDLLEVIRRYCKKTDTLLDIGCGTAFKTIQIADCVKAISGIEPNKKMRQKAIENIENSDIGNITITDGKAEEIPFDDNSFDIVTCMVAPHVTKEVHRILKKGGYAILEKIGDRDKFDLKKEFDTSGEALRGQFCEFGPGERLKKYEEEFRKLFSLVSTSNGFWNTFYSIEGIKILLEQTPSIKDYNEERDSGALESVQKKYMTDKGIKLTQNRHLIIAQK
ncbi:class I SAM-dependent methyltransferase [Candidatus Gracilibacteria bacterium]|nr:class I SAM-dependent methyltransferase [Candidatus Gracilibacteria bacterium]NUJ99386.1 class I SAM-dependent methyltransferase [Candidatus Gracilibacteria bacterium]